MARIVGRLTARQVANAKPPRGKDRVDISDGGNLVLQCTRSNDGHVARSWLFQYQLDGQRRWMGLGALHTISLSEARDKARTLRQQLIEGIDPLKERQKQRQARIAEQARAVTFREVTEDYLKLHLDSFGNRKHREAWRSTLEKYALPRLGPMTVSDVGPNDVLRVVEPHWHTKHETISRVRQRIEKILDYATARQYCSGDDPASRIVEISAEEREW